MGNPYFMLRFSGVGLKVKLQRASSIKRLGIITPPNPFSDQRWPVLTFDLDADIPDGGGLICFMLGIVLQGEMRQNSGTCRHRR